MTTKTRKPAKVGKARKPSAVRRGPRGSKVKVETIHFTQLGTLAPPPAGTVRIVNYGSTTGRVGRPRKASNPFLAL